ncbi:MAG: hypothetical protein EOM23_01045 [Candidatus Moranbacteria bacterium]|nr:hypothetical protein [Candidatus Moranbacteria bacterium]
MKIKKNIYIHLGTYKTGTTFIQNALYNNFNNKNKSIYYPKTGLYGTAHHYLSSWEFPRWTNGVTHLKFYKKWDQFLNEILQVESSHIVISSEIFSSLTLEQVKIIKNILNGYPLRAIIYLRRQDQYISSLAAQLIKGCNGDFEHYTDLNTAINIISSSPRMDYENMLENWANVIGVKNLIVRPYERSQFMRGDILTDFFYHLMGIFPDDNIKISYENANPRLCRDALEFKRLINQMSLSRDEKNSILPGLFEYSKIVDSNTNNFFHCHDLLSPEKKIEIINKYKLINYNIAKKYLKENINSLFIDKLEKFDSNWIPYSGLKLNKINEIIQFLINYDKNSMKLIEKSALKYKINNDDSDMKNLINALNFQEKSSKKTKSYNLSARNIFNFIKNFTSNFSGRHK